MMKSKDNKDNKDNIKGHKSAIVKAAQTLGADAVADKFWADVQKNIKALSGEVNPPDVKPRQTRTI